VITTVQTVANPDQSAEKGGLEPVKSVKGEPVKILKPYRIPKLVKNGNSDSKSESKNESKSESSTGSVETKTTEEDNGDNGGGEEAMETDDSGLSEAQVSDGSSVCACSHYLCVIILYVVHVL
jgi:hypothetical protein